MRIPATVVCAAILSLPARSEPLTHSDREALLENLEQLRESVDSKIDARFRQAITAYREAESSDQNAVDFYLKCTEKLNFIDQKKKASEFRDWKKKQEYLSDPNFGTTLRCQLKWLMLVLRASSEKADPVALAVEAQGMIDSIFNNAEKLKTLEPTLNQAVTSTVFAKIFEIEIPSKNKWPLSPVQIDTVYKEVIFPTMRGTANIEKLRAAWVKRITQEKIKVEIWQTPAPNQKKNEAAVEKSLEHQKFVEEVVPELMWQMETDLFRNGDEAGAAKRMLSHIQNHLDHKSSRAWGESFKNLLAPPLPTAESPDSKPAAP